MRSRFFMVVFLIILGIGMAGIILSVATPPPPPSPSPLQVSQQLEVPPEPEVTYTVWTTKHDLTKGDKVARDDFRLQKIPESEAFEYGIKQDVELTFADGMVMKQNLHSGGPVLPEQIAYPSDDGYYNLLIEPGYVPATVSVSRELLAGGVVEAGSFVDVLVLTSSTQNLSGGNSMIRDLENVSLVPIFTGVKVLQVNDSKKGSMLKETISSAQQVESPPNVSLILQLTRKQQAKLTIARSIARVEVHLSTGQTSLSELSADSGDIMSDYRSVRELRGGANEVVQ